MAEVKKEIKFEDALRKLQEAESKISSEDISLEESIKAYEEGIKNYKICADILKSAKQKIETIEKSE